MMGLMLVSFPIFADTTLVLSVDGEILQEYTYENLQALPQKNIKTHTIWSDGVQHFYQAQWKKDGG